MSTGFVPVICREFTQTVRRFDRKPDGRFALEILVSAFTVVPVWLQTVKANKSGRFGLLQVMLDNPGGQLVHQLPLQ